MDKNTVIALASSSAQAESLVRDLQAASFRNDDLSVLFPDAQSAKDFAHEHDTKAPESAIVGVGAGGALGGTVGLLAGIGLLAIPGLGPFIAAGPILATLSGAAAGAAVGGLTGALIGLGIPEIEAKQYEGKIRDGSILVTAHVADADARARAVRVLELGGARDVLLTRQEPQAKPAAELDPHNFL